MRFRVVRIEFERALEMPLGREGVPVVPDGQHSELRVGRTGRHRSAPRLLPRACLGHDLDGRNVGRGRRPVRIREADVGEGVVRVDRRRLFQELDSGLHFRQGDLLHVVPAPEVELIRLAARRVRLRDSLLVRAGQSRVQSSARCRAPSRFARRRGPSSCCRSARPRDDRRPRPLPGRAKASAGRRGVRSGRSRRHPPTAQTRLPADRPPCPCSETPCCAP